MTLHSAHRIECDGDNCTNTQLHSYPTIHGLLNKLSQHGWVTCVDNTPGDDLDYCPDCVARGRHER